MNLSQVAAKSIVPQILDAPPLKAEEPRPLWHMPVDIRSVSLALLATLACLYTLYWAKAVFIPVLLGLMSSYALTPVVDRLERLHPAGTGLGLPAFVDRWRTRLDGLQAERRCDRTDRVSA